MAKKLLSFLLAAAMLLTALFSLSASAAFVMRGDVDNDGRISSADARLALRGSVGLETLTADFLTRADVDANGAVESSDARTILRTSVSLDAIQQSDCAHQVGAWESVVRNDGSSAPYHKGKCALCGETVFADHDFELEITVPFTCTTPGEAIERCACGVTGDSVELPPQHTWEDVEGTRVEATCTSDGSVDMICSECGKTKTEFLPKGHVPGDEATCTAAQVCTRCGEVLSPALGHKYKPDAAVTVTKGVRCDRCGKLSLPCFNDLVNVLKDGTHTYTGFKVTVNSAEKPSFTGLMELMINMLPKKDREQMLAEFSSTETYYSVLVTDRAITSANYNLYGEDAVSLLEEGDVQSITTEFVKGVDFIAALPDSYTNERNREEDLTAIKNAAIGDVVKVTVTLAPETQAQDSAIAKLDSDLGDILRSSSSEIGGMAGDFDIFGEGSSKLTVDSVAGLTVTYYFDALTSAPIAAHYDGTVTIDSTMNLYINDDGEIQKDSTGSMNLKVSTDMDSYYFFDDHFNA